MAAYLIVDTKITDHALYEEYKAKAKEIVERHGGEYLARGGRIEIFEADLWHPSRLVVIRFPDMEAARAFCNDPDYEPVRRIRREASAATLAVVEGL